MIFQARGLEDSLIKNTLVVSWSYIQELTRPYSQVFSLFTFFLFLEFYGREILPFLRGLQSEKVWPATREDESRTDVTAATAEPETDSFIVNECWLLCYSSGASRNVSIDKPTTTTS